MKKSIGAKTVAYPTPVFVVGTYDADGRPNVMTAAWAGICCSKPPCVAVSLRKATYSYSCIESRKAFTVSIPSEDHVREADYFGVASGRDVDKFEVAGLTAARAEHVDAPYVEEFPLVLECRLLHVLEIGLHTQFVGEIVDVKADEDLIDERSKVPVAGVRPVAFCPDVHRYYSLGEELGKAFRIGRELEEQSE